MRGWHAVNELHEPQNLSHAERTAMDIVALREMIPAWAAGSIDRVSAHIDAQQDEITRLREALADKTAMVERLEKALELADQIRTADYKAWVGDTDPERDRAALDTEARR